MDIKTPGETVYYYECAHGSFRLLYFIPPASLEGLVNDDLIRPLVLEDYPDGVDLGCTLADFDEFHELYGYQPDIDPDEMQRTFFAMFSSMKGWETVRGSGFIKSGDLERYAPVVEESIERRKLRPEDLPKPPAEPSPLEQRSLVNERAMQQVQIREVLQDLDVEGIDPDETLRGQRFSRISLQQGIQVEKVFERLHKKQRG